MSIFARLRHFFTPFDARYEDLSKGNPVLNVVRDFTAGLVVAMVAIPLAIGLAIASGLRPEQGIVGGAVAAVAGALFGGSKYQVYGPTAAFIPIIGAIMAGHEHSYLVMCSLIAGAILMLLSLSGFGKIVKMVPHSIVVGFTIGIAFTIALSQGAEVFGLHAKSGYNALDKLHMLSQHYGHLEVEAVGLAIGTLLLTKLLLKISPYIPAPLVALAVGIGITQTVWKDEGLVLVRDKYGAIPAMAVHFTPPSWNALFGGDIGQIIYFSIAIVFVAAIESLLCSRMADRLAKNRGTPYDPDKELWGQGHVMIWVPLLNGFPHTGALARTATNIKLGAISPLAGIFKAVLKLSLAYYLATYLELVPMPCIGGILLYVAMNMVKREEVDEVFHMGRGHVWLMAGTALGVILTDFLRGVLGALAVYGIWEIYKRSRTQKPVDHSLGLYRPKVDAKHVVVPMHAHGEKAHPNGGPTVGAGTATAPNVRAVVGRSKAEAAVDPAARRTWLANIRRPGHMARSAFVHGHANVAGRVVLGEHVHIAAGSSVRADEGTPFYIGADTNIQDGVVIHALQDRHILVDGEPWAVYIGKSASIAHDALVHGPCYIGDSTFVGFKAVVHDAVVGPRCFIGIGAVVVGVEIPEGRFVPHGMIVDTNAKAEALPKVTAENSHFNADVVEVNRGLAAAYREHAQHGVPTGAMALLARDDGDWDPPAPLNDRF
jgi:sulfate permease, SulP family